MQHEGRIFLEDLLCAECSSQGKHAHHDAAFSHGEILHAFEPGSREDIQNMSLYDLGYPLGAHIEVIQRNGALDFLDTEKITRTVFALDEDHLKMHEIHKL